MDNEVWWQTLRVYALSVISPHSRCRSWRVFLMEDADQVTSAPSMLETRASSKFGSHLHHIDELEIDTTIVIASNNLRDP